MTIQSGSRLGPYEIVAPIGAGGMGEVFKAIDTRLGRSVAIKILPAEFAADARLKVRLEREARTISQLNHPNICTLHDVGHHDGIDYLVMELVEGETLASRLSKGALPIEQVMRYGVEIADALAKAHSKGIVHRDLKPENIMITRTGTKLLDFGLARRIRPASIDSATQHKSLSEDGKIVGTVRYMAPEQLEGREADPRTDIFAFGSVVYEMATGRRAFEGSTQASVVAAILHSEPKLLRELQPLAPAGLERVVRKCLQKDPADRWESAHDLADELRWIADESRTTAPAPLPARRRNWMALVLALAVTAIAALAIWQWADGASMGPPVVMLMDSTNPERIYSPVTRASGGTNADDLTNILRDLPITLVKENTNAFWNREDQVVKQRPALIVMHRSAFATADAALPDPKAHDYVFSLADRRMQEFVGYVGLASPDTKFILYSRNWELVGGSTTWADELQKRFPHLRGRVFTIQVVGRPDPSFRDRASAANLHRLVLDVLRLREDR